MYYNPSRIIEPSEGRADIHGRVGSLLGGARDDQALATSDASDQARGLETAQCLAHGRAVDRELARELGLGRQGIALLQVAPQDPLLDHR